MKRLKKTDYYVSSKGNLFLRSEYLNIEESKAGFKLLPLDEYPYTRIELPSIINEEIIREEILNTFWLGKRIKDY